MLPEYRITPVPCCPAALMITRVHVYAIDPRASRCSTSKSRVIDKSIITFLLSRFQGLLEQLPFRSPIVRAIQTTFDTNGRKNMADGIRHRFRDPVSIPRIFSLVVGCVKRILSFFQFLQRSLARNLETRIDVPRIIMLCGQSPSLRLKLAVPETVCKVHLLTLG